MYKKIRVTLKKIELFLQQHARHFTRPTSSHFIHFNATNSDVKSFRCTDFLLPLQSGHGSKRYPPQTLHVVRTLEL